MKNLDQNSLETALDHASPVPDMPMAAIHATAMDAFATQTSTNSNWTFRFGALAATIILGFGGFIAFQSYQSNQRAIIADADAFAEALLSESF